MKPTTDTPLETGRPVTLDPENLKEFDYGEFERDGKSMAYRIYSPPGADPEGDEKYPLILWLHGIKGRGSDNEHQLVGGGNGYGPAFFSSPEVQLKYPCHVLVPQCPKSKFWVNFTRTTSTKTLRRVRHLLRSVAATAAVDMDRLYISGQSMGGFATWVMITEYPDMFAAAIPISGGGPARKARKIRVPVWVFHGADDPLVRPWRSRSMVAAMEKAGKPVRYTEFPGGKHDIWPRIFAEDTLAHWLFTQRRPPVSIGEQQGLTGGNK